MRKPHRHPLSAFTPESLARARALVLLAVQIWYSEARRVIRAATFFAMRHFYGRGVTAAKAPAFRRAFLALLVNTTPDADRRTFRQHVWKRTWDAVRVACARQGNARALEEIDRQATKVVWGALRECGAQPNPLWVKAILAEFLPPIVDGFDPEGGSWTAFLTISLRRGTWRSVRRNRPPRPDDRDLQFERRVRDAEEEFLKAFPGCIPEAEDLAAILDEPVEKVRAHLVKTALTKAVSLEAVPWEADPLAEDDLLVDLPFWRERVRAALEHLCADGHAALVICAAGVDPHDAAMATGLLLTKFATSLTISEGLLRKWARRYARACGEDQVPDPIFELASHEVLEELAAKMKPTLHAAADWLAARFLQLDKSRLTVVLLRLTGAEHFRIARRVRIEDAAARKRYSTAFQSAVSEFSAVKDGSPLRPRLLMAWAVGQLRREWRAHAAAAGIPPGRLPSTAAVRAWLLGRKAACATESTSR